MSLSHRGIQSSQSPYRALMYSITTLAALWITLAGLGVEPLTAQTMGTSMSSTGSSSADTSVFAPLRLTPAPSGTRLANGTPGPKYWQNRTDYDLRGTLDTATHTLHGTMTLRYTNNSPDTLGVFWFQTEQPEEVIDQFDQIIDAKAVSLVHRHLGDTFELQVILATPLPPGKTATFHAAWHFNITDGGGLRMGRDGALYEIAQWYPRPNVYDDVKGWNTESYATNAEFYLEYGNYNVEVTVPAGYIVAGTGTLENPQTVLTPTEIIRLAHALTTDSIVHIVTPGELQSGAARPTQTGMLTWKFHATNTRDAVWAAAPNYQWDATRWDGILAQAYYRPSAVANWQDAADQARMSIQEYSERWFPYPYPQISVVEGPVPGMEYPMLAMESDAENQPALYAVVTHEVGHNWFPMIVGSNERMHAWMDEGFNTFVNSFSEARRYPQNGDQAARIRGDAQQETDGVIETGAPTGNGDPNQYFKTAHVLQLLRQNVLGPVVFDSAFRIYIRRWAYKHPTPADFFRTIEDVSGKQLDWFWREWFWESPRLDQAIDSVTQTVQGNTTHVTVTYGNHGRMVLPLVVRFTFADSTTQELTYPADVWKVNSTAFTVSYSFPKRVSSIVLDPKKDVPDVQRSNNVWSDK